jgi:AraC-like DNA-binding protein/mannose-6-phosphate isomerase-like protein (cupin superfamily)
MNNFKQTIYTVRPDLDLSPEADIHISVVGLLKSSGDFLWEQVVDFLSVHVIEKGSGVMEVNNKPIPLSAGEMLIFFPGDHIRYYDFPETPWQYIWIRLDGRMVEAALLEAGLKRGSQHLNISANHEFNLALKETVENFKLGGYSKLYPAAAGWKILNTLALRNPLPQTENHAEKLVKACCDFLESQLVKTLNVNELSEHFGVDRTTVFRSFKSCLGISPKEFIDQLRFKNAGNLLKLTQRPIKEIATACGFERLDYFCSAFKKRFGVSPSQWRRQN